MNYKIAARLSEQIARIPGAADVHVHQVVNAPELRINVDRIKAGQLGLTQSNVASSLLISLSGSSQVAPNFWLNWKNGVSYNVLIQTPQYKLDSLDKLMRTPVSVGSAVAFNTPGSMAGSANEGDASTGTAPNQSSAAYGNPGTLPYQTQLLSNLATIEHSTGPRDLESLQRAAGLRRVRQCRPARPGRRSLAGGKTHRQHQDSQDHADLFARAGRHHEQLFLSPRPGPAGGHRSGIPVDGGQFSVLGGSVHHPVGAFPGALAGILWMLFVTQTTLNVPSLMGAIMCIGVATANSILMVVFANDERMEGKGARAAALSAGYTRLRPVLMTAAAMILGMLPMALGIGEGAEQNSPLGRAVIGGLLLATVTTLFIVPDRLQLPAQTAARRPRQADRRRRARGTAGIRIPDVLKYLN